MACRAAAPLALAAAIAVMSCCAGCGVEHLPPPQAPARDVPSPELVPTHGPAPGTGRVVVDANGEQAEVAMISATDDPSVVAITPLCTTPCVIDLPYGPHPLLFHSTTDPTRESEAEIDVGPRAKVLRHTMGERREPGTANTAGTAMIVIGAIAATTGVILLSAAAAGPDDGRGAIAPLGQAFTIAGAVSALFGIPLLLSDRPSERPGATTEWSLPSRYDEPSTSTVGSSTRR